MVEKEYYKNKGFMKGLGTVSRCMKIMKCRCQCKEFIDMEICDKGFIWNPSNYEYECDKLCDVGEYLDYETCNCRKKFVEKLVEGCNKNIDEVVIAGMTFFERRNECKSWCTIHVVLIPIVFTTSIGIGTYFIYYK